MAATRKKTPQDSHRTPLTIVDIPLKDIDASDDTFRQRAIMAVDDLVAELRATPQQVPVFLRRRADRRYQIVAGFRRVHALKELGRATAKAVVLTVGDAEAWLLAWAENIGHKKLRGVDLSYLVFRLHDEGHNAEEIAHLCGMTARDAERVQTIGRLPDEVRALIRAHDLTLRHAAVLAAFVKRNPRVDVTAAVADAASRGLGEVHFAQALEALTRRKGRRVVGVSFRDANRYAIDTARADPTAWSATVRKRMRELAAWIEESLAATDPTPPTRSRPKRAPRTARTARTQ